MLPILFRLIDKRLIAGDEIPFDFAWPIHGRAAADHTFRTRLQPNGDIDAPGQYEHLSFAERLTANHSTAADEIDCPLFGECVWKDQVGAFIRLESHLQDWPWELHG